MAKPRTRTTREDTAAVATVSMMNDEMRRACLEIGGQIKANGFVPIYQLRKEHGDKAVTVFAATAYRDYRIVREARRPWSDGESVTGYEWADVRFSRSASKKIPAALGWILELCPEQVLRYKDFARAIVQCRWNNWALGALPITGGDDKRRVFERANGHLVIPAYGVRAMLRKTLPMVGKAQSLADHIRCAAVLVPASVITGASDKSMPVVNDKMHQGLGVNMHEAIPPETPFILDLWYPASEITEEELLTVLALAGRFTRLSPARSSGYGDFDVLALNGEPVTASEAVQ